MNSGVFSGFGDPRQNAVGYALGGVGGMPGCIRPNAGGIQGLPSASSWVPNADLFNNANDAWYDASVLGLADGATPAAWNDLTTYGHNMTNSGSPVFRTNQQNELPAFTFNGTTQKWASSVPSSTYPQTRVIVASFDSGSTGGGPVLGSSQNGGIEFDLGIDAVANALLPGVFGFWSPGVATGPTAFTSQLTNTDFHVLAAVATSTTYALYVDGLLVKFGINTLSLSGGRVAYVGGAVDTSGQRWFKGRIAEVMMFGTVKTDIELSLIFAYLADKWALPLFPR